MIIMIVIFSSSNVSRAEPANERKIPISAVAVMHCEYSPVSFWNKTTGTPSGFFVDLMDRVAAHAGLRVSYICRNDWDETIAAIGSGEADLGVLLKSEEREKKLLFSIPIDTTYLSFFVRSQSNIDPATVPSEYIVGVIKGSMSHEKLKDRKGLRLQIYGGYREGLFGLLAGEIGLLAGEESMVLKQMREIGLEDRIKKVGRPFAELQRCMAVRKDNVQLLELMNNTLKDFVSGPEYQRIYLKWYGAPMPYWTNRRVLTASGVFLVIAISGAAFWRYVSISKINKELIRTMSERRKAEEQVKQSLREKETLLREIHHRVKNNMAVVSSLLSIQANKIKDATVRSLFEESQQRVRSMALVHEKLYQAKDLSSIDFDDYIKSIVSEIISLYRIDTNAITTEINVEGIELDLESAVPCCLIINELLTNVFKHAFPDNRRGTLSIHFTKTDGEAYTLTIKDNGIGLPKGSDHKETGDLGLQLVNVLTRQLRGTFQLKSDKGMEVVVTFPKGIRHGKEKHTDS
jgi:two-component sensor histidine kinase/ABC-type amino acid transport substrate-binding protein